MVGDCDRALSPRDGMPVCGGRSSSEPTGPLSFGLFPESDRGGGPLTVRFGWGCRLSWCEYEDGGDDLAPSISADDGRICPSSDANSIFTGDLGAPCMRPPNSGMGILLGSGFLGEFSLLEDCLTYRGGVDGLDASPAPPGDAAVVILNLAIPPALVLQILYGGGPRSARCVAPHFLFLDEDLLSILIYPALPPATESGCVPNTQ